MYGEFEALPVAPIDTRTRNAYFDSRARRHCTRDHTHTDHVSSRKSGVVPEMSDRQAQRTLTDQLSVLPCCLEQLPNFSYSSLVYDDAWPN